MEDKKKSNVSKNSLNDLKSELNDMLSQFNKINTTKIDKEDSEELIEKAPLKEKTNIESTEKNDSDSLIEIEFEETETAEEVSEIDEVFLDVTPEATTSEDSDSTTKNPSNESFLSIKDKLAKIQDDIKQEDSNTTKDQFNESIEEVINEETSNSSIDEPVSSTPLDNKNTTSPTNKGKNVKKIDNLTIIILILFVISIVLGLIFFYR